MSTITTTQPKRKLNLSPITVRVLSSPCQMSAPHEDGKKKCKNNSNTSPHAPEDRPANSPAPSPPAPQRDGAA